MRARLTLVAIIFSCAVLLMASAAMGAPSGRLTLYTSQPDADAQKTVAAFQSVVS